ncbi:MAG: 8-methylmenaquinol:fumarate reductase flavoprotein subunit [Fimbriimonadales bacterium]|nr:MAG: fumarate reductase/succinate dehydrogenase flavoprotein subunit [Armatimonadota bacterium]MBV6502030.1 8-methylmenaquinol:fumarate reductase flavoprotein subunit [Fimbriimonadales bacterium]MCE7898865.1 fumarate reductase/succinate dehydrogenase flavoprotein subunit [Armatimonadetes bacterium ATM1]MDL1928929.1 fumarate reductase/succinate dehydrogenase flavoprotein subunit [Fimbriimonadia bacterium ATM]MBC6969596.1 fumarate reductase/succinate dehydrogenase flavoprotein subunit [Armatim
MPQYDTFEHDVLIVGAGGAGLRAAIGAVEKGCSVCVVTKSLLGKAHTVMAEGGAAAALGNFDNQDGWKVHFRDTMRGGKFLNNWRTVQIFAMEAPERILELERYGAVFDRTPEGLISQRAFGGHRYRRLAHVGDRTGLELIRTLQDKAVSVGIDVQMEVTLTRLLTDGGRVTGAVGYRREDGSIVVFRAKAVVLCSGGWGRMFRFTSNSWESTGDGAVMAYEAGAELQDMEMVQFHPTGMIWPPGVRGVLVTEGVRGDGGVLKNGAGERFMFNHVPEFYRAETAETPEEALRWVNDKVNNRRPPELLPRDVVARAIYKEVEAGRGSEHGGAYLDVSHMGAEYIKRKLPSMYDQFLHLGDVDITKQPMEVYPTVHYTMGGVPAEPESCATSLPGLYAAGECACGLHGANRLGGNSLTDLLVFGKRAGEAAGDFAIAEGPGSISEAEIQEEVETLMKPLGGSGGENPYQIHAELQEQMQSGAMIARTEEGLRQTLDKIHELQRRAEDIRVPGDTKFNPGWHAARDVKNMLVSSEIIVLSALERKESRGAQWRLDYPNEDAYWARNNVIAKKIDGKVSISHREVPEPPSELKELLQD